MENKANLSFSLDVQKLKGFQLQGASPPDHRIRGSAPGPCWGLRPQTPAIGSRSCARHVRTINESLGKKANLPFFLDLQKLKGFQLQGAWPPDSLTKGSAPGPRWGFRPHTPAIGSNFSHNETLPCTQHAVLTSTLASGHAASRTCTHRHVTHQRAPTSN